MRATTIERARATSYAGGIREVKALRRGSGAAAARAVRRAVTRASGAEDPILLRAARGEDVERPPVWLMRQAGRYMAEFRAYSTKYGFRHRSETPDIAIELSLQPWRAFKPDGVIMFSDILTPLPALGIEFDVVKGKGPVVEPVRTMDDVNKMKMLDDPATQLPFVREILSSLRQEIDGQSTMLGFIGSPWTLAAYAMEGSSDRHLTTTKQIMTKDPKTLHAFLSKLADALGVYVCYQIESGAQVVQIFDSWAHHLSPQQFLEFSHPYNERVTRTRRSSSTPTVDVVSFTSSRSLPPTLSVWTGTRA